MFNRKIYIYSLEIFFLFLLVLLSSLFYLSQTSISLFFNFDFLYFPALFKDLLIDNGHYKDWTLSPAPHFFPDWLIFIPVFLATKKVYFQFLIVLCIQTILMYLAMKFLYRQFFSSNKSRIFSLLSLSFVCLLAVNPYQPYVNLFIPAVHIGELIAGIFYLSIQIKLINRAELEINSKNYSLFTIGVIVAFLASLSDLLFVVQFSIPIFLSYCTLLIQNYNKIIKTFKLFICSFFASLLGAFLTKYIVPSNILFAYLSQPSIKKISLHTVTSQLFLLIQLFKEHLIWQIAIPFFVFYIGILLLVIIYIYRIAAKKNIKISIKNIFFSFFILFCIVCSISSILTLVEAPYVADRYLYPVFFFPLITFFYLTKFFENSMITKLLIILLIIFYITFTILKIFDFLRNTDFKNKNSYYPEEIRCIDDSLQNYGKYGIGNYSTRYVISMLSKKNIKVEAFVGELAMFPVGYNIQKYRNSYSFIMFNLPPFNDPPWEKMISEKFKKVPEKIVVCGNKKLFIYSENSIKLPIFREKGDKFTWNACSLPGQFSTVPDCKRIAEKRENGYLSYGPFVSLPQGHYTFLLTYASDAPSNEKVARWEVSSTKKESYLTDSLFGSNNKTKKISGNFFIDTNSKGELFEIKLFSLGKAKLVFESLTLIKD